MGLWEPGPGPRREEAEAQGADAGPAVVRLPLASHLSPSYGFIPFFSFEIFSPVLFFKIRRKYPANGRFTKSMSLIFPPLPTRVGETRPLFTDPSPQPPYLPQVLCSGRLYSTMSALDQVRCWHAPHANGLLGAWSPCHPPTAL